MSATDNREQLYATITLEVKVYKGKEPQRNTEYGVEPGREYLVVRDVDVVNDTCHGNPHAGILAEEEDDLDVDDLLISSVKTSLRGFATEEEAGL